MVVSAQPKPAQLLCHVLRLHPALQMHILDLIIKPSDWSASWHLAHNARLSLNMSRPLSCCSSQLQLQHVLNL